MGKTIMSVAAISLDGFIADDHDGIDPLFDWLDNGDVAWSFPGNDRSRRSTRASADFMLDYTRDVAAAVIGRRLFDLTDGWGGKVDTAGEHVFVVTHQPPVDWAIAAARDFTSDRDVNVFSGQIGGQALALGLIDQLVINLVPVILGSGRPFFATGPLAGPLRLENPTTIVRGDRVTHLVYDVSR